MKSNRPVVVNLPKLFDRVPPSDPESEAALLGSLVLDGDRLNDVRPIVVESDFSDSKHGCFFRLLCELYDGGKPIDAVTINTAANDSELLKSIGGLDYVIQLADSVPSAASAEFYATQVKASSLRRQLAEASTRWLHAAYTSADTPAQIIGKAQVELMELACKQTGESDVVTIGDAAKRAVVRTEENFKRGGPDGLVTGFRRIDEVVLGMRPGDYVLVGARPSMGKTSLATAIAINNARAGVPVAFFSVEQPPDAIAARSLSMESGVEASWMRRPTHLMAEDNFASMGRAASRLEPLPLYLVDCPGLTVELFTSHARKLAKREGVKLVIIDYAQLMTLPVGGNENEALTVLSRAIKATLRSTGLVGIVLVQVNRGAEDSANPGLPQLKHIRGSGSFEQDADTVMFIHRPDYYERRQDPSREPDGKAIIGIQKQRDGATGNIEIGFDARHTQFLQRSPDEYGTEAA